MTSPASLLLQDGALFHGRYRVQRCIRAGGMGAVYEVLDESTKRRRALKVMLPSLVNDADSRARFVQEATITSEIESEHLVDIHDAGVDAVSGVPYLVMDLLKGEEVGELLSRCGRLPAEEALGILRQAARVIDQTHEMQIVHRDLKPENLFLTRLSDPEPRLKVLDFGIAKVVAASMTSARPTRSVGTPLYMAPEQARGDGTIDGRADLYSLAHIAFALLVGKPYFDPESNTGDGVYPVLIAVTSGVKEPASVRAARAGAPPLPADFDGWFARAAALDPQARFDTGIEMVESLAVALGLAKETSSAQVSRASAVARPLEGEVPPQASAVAPDPAGSTSPALSSPSRVSTPPLSIGGRRVPLARVGLAVLGLGGAVAVLWAGARGGPSASEPGSDTPSRDVSTAPSVSSDVPTASTELARKKPPLSESVSTDLPLPAVSIAHPAATDLGAPEASAQVPSVAVPIRKRAVPVEKPPEQVW